MKKTMILGAAALAATMAMGVESSVVGYQKIATEDGFTYVTPTFDKTSGALPTLGDFKPVGDSAGYGTESIQTFDSEGGFVTSYTYYEAWMAGANESAGWFEVGGSAEESADATPIGGKGRAVVFNSPATDLQFSGKVPLEKKEITAIDSGFTYIGNATPVTLDINDFVPKGDNVGYGTESIQTFDREGGFVTSYIYYAEWMAGANESAGWFEVGGSTETPATLEIAPGRGFIFNSNGDCTIELPDPSMVTATDGE